MQTAVDPLNPIYQEPPSSHWKNYIVEFIQTLAVCMVIGIIVYWQVAQPHKVSGASMVPNFHNGDYIITNKIVYRFATPKRGDVIVLKNPHNTSEDFIKRIIGLPGERVKVEGGVVYINGFPLTEPYLAQNLRTPSGAFLREGLEVLVPPANFIVLGDNRTASSDSREWGFLPSEDIKGLVFIRYWPKEDIGIIPSNINYPNQN